MRRRHGKKVYRYEAWDGTGPYANLCREQLMDGCYDRHRHPEPPKLIRYKYYRCIYGFPSKVAARRWFQAKEISILRRHGYRLRCYVVDRLKWSTKQQCIFDRRCARLLKDQQ